MRRGYPPVWLGILLLTLAVFWRMAGAPVTAEEFGALETPFWQMRTLAPARMTRIFRLWFSAPAEPADDLLLREDAGEEGLSLARQTGEDQQKNMTVWLEDGLPSQPLESYVCGVVAAEMPAAYHLEALKAQAVAARTRAVRQQRDGGCSRHPGADICGDSACCQGYVGKQPAGKNGAGNLNFIGNGSCRRFLKRRTSCSATTASPYGSVPRHERRADGGRAGGVLPKPALSGQRGQHGRRKCQGLLYGYRLFL